MRTQGKLTTIVGPMGSGKTLELIRLLTISEIQGKKVLVAKNNIDTRDIKNPNAVNNIKIQSRLGIEYDAVSFPNQAELLKYINKSEEKIDVVGIEEGHFWSTNLDLAVLFLLANGIDVYITGLNQDFRGKPFGIMPRLIALSDDIIHLKGVCSKCHAPATKTQRIINNEPAPAASPLILVGADLGNERYECRCYRCWQRPV